MDLLAALALTLSFLFIVCLGLSNLERKLLRIPRSCVGRERRDGDY